MPKLTPDEIQFVDNYLDNSGVVYVDVRYEMTDHVATALEEMEGSFPENFRAYMNIHKAELLKSNNKFRRGATKRAWKLLLGNFIKPQFLCLAVIIFLTAFWSQSQIGYKEAAGNFLIFHMLISLGMFITTIIFWLASEKKYSVVDKLTGFCYFFPIFFRLDRVITDQEVLLVFNSAYTSFMILLIYTIFQLHRRYKLMYHA